MQDKQKQRAGESIWSDDSMSHTFMFSLCIILRIDLRVLLLPHSLMRKLRHAKVT